MEPMQDKNSVPDALSQTSKRYIVMPPFAPLARRTDEIADTPSSEFPAGVPMLSTEDFTWYSSSNRGQQVTAPSTPSPSTQRSPASPKQEPQDLSSARLVRSLAKPTNHGQGTLFSQATSSYRWEQQTFRYPDELLQIM